VIAIDLFPDQPAHIEQRSQTHLVRPFRQHLEPELGDDAVLAGQRDDIGQSADCRDLDERGKPARMPGLDA
jgi:hypothetical protein